MPQELTNDFLACQEALKPICAKLQRQMTGVLETYIELGGALSRAKERLPHGDFEKLLKAEGISKTTAWRARRYHDKRKFLKGHNLRRMSLGEAEDLLGAKSAQGVPTATKIEPRTITIVPEVTKVVPPRTITIVPEVTKVVPPRMTINAPEVTKVVPPRMITPERTTVTKAKTPDFIVQRPEPERDAAQVTVLHPTRIQVLAKDLRAALADVPQTEFIADLRESLTQLESSEAQRIKSPDLG